MDSVSISLDFHELYRLGDPIATRPLRLSPDDVWANSETAWQLFRGHWQPPEPIVMRAEMGGHASDFLWSTFPPLLCVSRRVTNLLNEYQATGWATYPVKVFDRQGMLIEGYRGFAVMGEKLERNLSCSDLVTKPAPTPTGKSYQVYRGLYFDENQWNGSDLFLVDGFIIVSRRVQEAFAKTKVTNVRFTRLTEVETNVHLERFGG